MHSYYNSSSDSIIECSFDSDSTLSDLIYESDYFVNPEWNGLVGKVIIINLPTKLNLDIFNRRNNLIMRYDLGIGKYIPFPEVNISELTNKNYSNRILNKYMLTDPDYSVSISDNYILGTDIVINNDLTLIGFIITKTFERDN